MTSWTACPSYEIDPVRPVQERFAVIDEFMIDRARDLLTRVGLEERLEHRPTQLSGGEQQRVAIARALVGRPIIILADEPTGNVDSSTGRGIMELLRRLNRDRGVTLLLVTHDAEAAGFAERVVHLRDGQIDHEGGRP